MVNFGEVVLPSSRAFWDDEDEYEEVENLEQHSKLSVDWQKSKPEQLQKFILIEGNPLIPFAEQCLCYQAEKACVVKNDNKKVSIIYELDKYIYLCIILPQFDIKDAGIFINEISDLLLNAKNVTSIVCHHVSQFQSTNIPNSPSFLRMLTTKNMNNASKCNVKILEQPNIIFGVAAGVLSYAEFKDMSAKLYALYIDGFVLDSKCAQPLLEVLTNEMSCKLQHLKFTENFFSKGNLYV